MADGKDLDLHDILLGTKSDKVVEETMAKVLKVLDTCLGSIAYHGEEVKCLVG